MAAAIKKISIERGHDVGGYALVCFGGAGGQHACAVADAIGIKRIMIHPLAGVLSAYGIGLAEQRLLRHKSIEQELSAALLPALAEAFEALEREMLSEVRDAAGASITRVRRLLLKYAGTDTTLPIVFGPLEVIVRDFETAYRKRFAFAADKAVIVDAIASEIVIEAETPPQPAMPTADGEPEPELIAPVFLGGALRQTPFYRRDKLAAGARVAGPAVIIEDTTTTLVEEGWSATLHGGRRAAVGARRRRHNCRDFGGRSRSRAAGAVQQPLYGHRRTDGRGATEHGLLRQYQGAARFLVRLVRRARSPHRQRATHSSASGLHGRERAGRARRTHDRMAAASVAATSIALNNPYCGGTHLPDLTVVMPVFGAGGAKIDFFVAARGHHADIGGITPGSMPPSQPQAR